MEAEAVVVAVAAAEQEVVEVPGVAAADAEAVSNRLRRLLVRKLRRHKPGVAAAEVVSAAAGADPAFHQANTLSKLQRLGRKLQLSCAFKKIRGYRSPKPIARSGATRL